MSTYKDDVISGMRLGKGVCEMVLREIPWDDEGLDLLGSKFREGSGNLAIE
jgi:hypothetical protein